MIESQACHGIRGLFVLLLAGVVFNAMAADDVLLPTYRWEAEQLYRYQFLKRAVITDLESKQSRTTECRCVLVFEVESVNAKGNATATIRYLTPEIVMPRLAVLDQETNKRVLELTRSYQLARAVQDVLAEVHWPVTLGPDGAIRLRERPSDWRKWMSRIERTGSWPKRLGGELDQLLDKHFSIGKEETSDDEWLPVLRKDLPGGRVKGLRAFRPRRRVKIGEAQPNGRLALHLSRDPEESPPAVNVPLLDAKGITLTLTRESVKTLAGEAVFDTKLGLLDSSSERYQVSLASRCGIHSQRAEVTVTYELKRLIPPLRKAATEKADAPGFEGAPPAGNRP